MSKHSQLTLLNDKMIQAGGKILVIQTAFLGDVILTTALIRALKSKFPLCQITALTIPQCASVLAGWADQMITFDKRNKSRVLWDELIREIQSNGFDAAIIPHRSFRSGYLGFRAGIPVRIGFSKGSASLFHTHRVHYPSGMYEGLRNLKLVEVFGKHDDSGLPELIIPAQDTKFVLEYLDKTGINPDTICTMAPGSVWETKKWPISSYRDLAYWIEKESGLHVMIIGGKEDQQTGGEIITTREHNLAGKLTVLQSAALIKMSKFLISGDSAPAHLATACQTRQILIFGSTDPRFGFSPPTHKADIYGLDMWCRPCTDHGRQRCPLGKTPKCLAKITPSVIYNDMKKWL